MSTISTEHRKRRDSLAQDYVMEMLRKSRPQSMDIPTCVKFAASAYRLADAMIMASNILPEADVTVTTSATGAVDDKKLRFITHHPRAVYDDGLWVNVNLDLSGEFSMPSFVEPKDVIKIIRKNGNEIILSAENAVSSDWASAKSFRKLG